MSGDALVRVGVVVALGAALLVVNASPSQAATTRAEYVAEADPECADANQDIKRINQRYSRLHRQGKYRAAGALLRKTGVRLSRSVDRVARIVPPPGDEELVAAWLGLVRDVARNNKRMAPAEARREFKVRGRFQKQNQRIGRRAHLLVADFGFQHCA